MQVNELVLDLFEKARKAKYPLTRAAIMSFGRAVKKTLLDRNKVSEGKREKLEGFKAGEKWAKNFVSRNGLVSNNLFGEAGSVDREEIKKGIYVKEWGVSDDEKEESHGESTGWGGIAPPPYTQLSQYFGPLERAAEEFANREAAFYLQKAKLAMIKAHAPKPVRQSDIRAFVEA